MLQILIPMAGRGSRFAQAGYEMPKPLIDVYGHPMVEYVIRNVTPSEPHRFIFLCLKEHLDEFRLAERLETMAPGCAVVPVDHVTEGAACTALLAEKYIDNDEPLMTANSDQYVDIRIDDYLAAMKDRDGLIMTLPCTGKQWSYIRYSEAGLVTEVREKEEISDTGTVGIYNFRRGRDYVRAAKQMIAKNLRVNGEFYLAPVYNELIAEGAKIGYWNAGRVGEQVFGTGTPADLEAFMKTEACRKVFAGNFPIAPQAPFG